MHQVQQNLQLIEVSCPEEEEKKSRGHVCFGKVNRELIVILNNSYSNIFKSSAWVLVVKMTSACNVKPILTVLFKATRSVDASLALSMLLTSSRVSIVVSIMKHVLPQSSSFDMSHVVAVKHAYCNYKQFSQLKITIKFNESSIVILSSNTDYFNWRNKLRH